MDQTSDISIFKALKDFYPQKIPIKRIFLTFEQQHLIK